MNRDIGYINTVKPSYNGPAGDGNPPITEAILKFLEKFVFNFYIGNYKNPLLTDTNGRSLSRYTLFSRVQATLY